MDYNKHTHTHIYLAYPHWEVAQLYSKMLYEFVLQTGHKQIKKPYTSLSLQYITQYIMYQSTWMPLCYIPNPRIFPYEETL